MVHNLVQSLATDYDKRSKKEIVNVEPIRAERWS